MTLYELNNKQLKKNEMKGVLNSYNLTIEGKNVYYDNNLVGFLKTDKNWNNSLYYTFVPNVCSYYTRGERFIELNDNLFKSIIKGQNKRHSRYIEPQNTNLQKGRDIKWYIEYHDDNIKKIKKEIEALNKKLEYHIVEKCKNRVKMDKLLNKGE